MSSNFLNFFKRMKEKDFLVSIFFLMVLQGILYFSIKFFQSDYHYINAIIDTKIPFIPWFIYPYNLFYPYIFLSFYYIYCKDIDVYKKGVFAGILGYLTCDVIFLIYPTMMARADISSVPMDFFTKFVVDVTYFFDQPPLNCLPSVHVLFCIQVIYTTIFCKDISRKYKAIMIITGLVISASTLLVKQHYFYDVIAAFIVCSLANIIVFIIKKRK